MAIYSASPSVQCNIREDAGSLVSYCRTQPVVVLGEDYNKSIFEFGCAHFSAHSGLL